MDNKICNKCGISRNIDLFETYDTKVGKKHTSVCKVCRSEKSEFSIYDDDDITNEKIIEVYKELISGDRKVFPAIISQIKPKTYLILSNYLFRDLLGCDTKEKVCENFSGKILKQYKYNFHSSLNMGIMELLKSTFSEYDIKPWELKYGNVKGMYDSDEDKKECIEWFLDSLIKDRKIVNYIDVINRNDIYVAVSSYGISGLLRKFKGSTVNMLMWYFNNFTNNKINEWDFYLPPRNFWKNEENSIRAFKYALEKSGFYNLSKYEKKEFLIEINNKFFNDNKIDGCLKLFKNKYGLISVCFGKDYIYEWQMNKCSKFWESEENRKIALKQLIEDVLKLKKEDIPKYIKQSYLKNTDYNKFNMPCIKYYNGNYYWWVESIYPGMFSEEDFSVIKSKDGVLMLSNEERLIYEYIKYNLNIDIKYIGKEKSKIYCYHNGDTKYQPDYVIEDLLDKPIIIEHFGYWSENKDNVSSIVKNYSKRAKDKIKFYESLDYIYFIYTVPKDIRFKFDGVKRKLEYITKN